jgi:hypothetical protein
MKTYSNPKYIGIIGSLRFFILFIYYRTVISEEGIF